MNAKTLHDYVEDPKEENSAVPGFFPVDQRKGVDRDAPDARSLTHRALAAMAAPSGRRPQTEQQRGERASALTARGSISEATKGLVGGAAAGTTQKPAVWGTAPPPHRTGKDRGNAQSLGGRVPQANWTSYGSRAIRQVRSPD